MEGEKNIFQEIKTEVEKVFKFENIKDKNLKDLQEVTTELSKIIRANKELIEQNNTLRIGIIGQVKAGKSSFLNALLFEGKDLLPKAATPMTAGLTVIGYSDVPRFKVEYYSVEDWAILEQSAKTFDLTYEEMREARPDIDPYELLQEVKESAGDVVCSAKELVERCSVQARSRIGAAPLEENLLSIDELLGKLEQYVGAEGEFTSVTKTLYLYLPEDRLKGVEIVDTPGINDPIVSREERTNEFLRSCHGVFLLSYAGQFCSSTDMRFLRERVYNQGISSVVILASKFDSGLIDIAREAQGDINYGAKHLGASLQEGLDDAFNRMNIRDRKQPKIDCISGICYSLYVKDETQWDENELHVAKLLRQKYPAINSSKEYFKALANIDKIDKEYVEGDFKANKEQIIQDKNKEFVAQNMASVSKKILSVKESLEKRLIILRKSNQETIEIQFKQSDNVQALGRKSKSIINKHIKNINNFPDLFVNDIGLESFSIVHAINQVRREVKVSRIINIFPKKIEVNLEQVDSNKLRDDLTIYYKNEIKKIKDKWVNFYTSDSGEISKFKQGIDDILLKEFSSIDPEMFKEALDSVLSDVINIGKRFPTEDMITFVESRIKVLIPNPDRDWLNKTISRKVNYEEKCATEVRKEIALFQDAVKKVEKDFKAELRNYINNSKGEIANQFSKLQKDFESVLNKAYLKIVEGYKGDIGNKEAICKEMSEVISILSKSIPFN